jgi:hypothetical protein
MLGLATLGSAKIFLNGMINPFVDLALLKQPGLDADRKSVENAPIPVVYQLTDNDLAFMPEVVSQVTDTIKPESYIEAFTIFNQKIEELASESKQAEDKINRLDTAKSRYLVTLESVSIFLEEIPTGAKRSDLTIAQQAEVRVLFDELVAAGLENSSALINLLKSFIALGKQIKALEPSNERLKEETRRAVLEAEKATVFVRLALKSAYDKNVITEYDIKALEQRMKNLFGY